MARANPANKSQSNDVGEIENNNNNNNNNKQEPIIEYFGEGAEDMKVDIEPNATRIRVYASGLILTDY